jgi:hypothetical protein
MSASSGERLYDALNLLSVGGFDIIWSRRGKAYQKIIERAAAQYDRATAERIAELENNYAEACGLLADAVIAADVATIALESCAAENTELRKAWTLASDTAAATVKENCALRERLAKLEAACAEIVNLRDEAADDPTSIINRSLQKLDQEIVLMSVMLP